MTKRYVHDEQTGEIYELQAEMFWDRFFAIVSIIYLLIILTVMFWLLFDIWISRYTLAKIGGYSTEQLSNPNFRLFTYAFIGGILGGTVNGIRSFLRWHAEHCAFGARFVWKYITAPFLGAALSLFTLALIRSGIAVFGGDGTPDATSFSQILATFSLGVLSGYGAREVFIWLDAQVKRFFRVQPTMRINVPDLTGITQKDAEGILRRIGLSLGTVSEGESPELDELIGKIIYQTPPPNSLTPSNGVINVTVGAAGG
jgi:hypothetical protein